MMLDMTFEQLKAATKQQIIDTVVAKLNTMTKRSIVETLTGRTEFADTPTRRHRADGQIEHETHSIRNASGSLQETRSIDWSYYPTGEIDIIRITRQDSAGDVISQKVIKHYLDGRQPTVESE